jgi:CRP-like cAMP-binding protein
LAQGSCEVLVRDQTKQEHFVHELVPGSMFGEVALIFRTKRTASVRSKDQCTVGALSEELFFEMCREFPEISEKMKE